MKFMRGLMDKADDLNNDLAAYPIMAALRHGCIYLIPLILVGSVALILSSIPIEPYQRFMAASFGAAWSSFLRSIYNGTLGILSITLVLSGSYAYASDFVTFKKYANPIVAAATSLACFVILTGLREDSLSSFGIYGLFPAVFTMMVSSVLFRKLCSIRALRLEFLTHSGNPGLNNAVILFMPMALTLAFFAALGILFKFVLGIPDLRAGLSEWFAHLFAGIASPFVKGLLYVILLNFLWFLGINGTAALEKAAAVSFAAAGSGSPCVFSQPFFDAFVFMGGCGSALCLVLALSAARRRSVAQSRVARLSFFPVLFNMSEVVVLGLPILLNPFFLIPFLCVPVVTCLISCLAMELGIVPYAVSTVSATTPVFFSGFLATGSVAGILLQAVNITVGTLIYLPFVQNSQRNMIKWRNQDIRRLLESFRLSEQRGEGTSFLTRHDTIGNLARTLVHDLEKDLNAGAIELHYQPIVDRDGRVDSVEVLLRWNHKEYGYLYPPLVIALAEEAGLAGRLGNWIFDEACRNAGVLCKVGFPNIPFCVNVSEAQLKESDFIEGLQAALDKYALPCTTVEIEVTERIALTGSRTISQRISDITTRGIHLVMDDFGAGHSSLIYLKEYNFSKVKLDGSLIREINTNPNCREIVKSIISLGRELRYSVIAEYVESQDQRDMLISLGCERFQGYFFSPAVPFSELYDYIVRTEQRIVPTLCLSALRMSDEDA